MNAFAFPNPPKIRRVTLNDTHFIWQLAEDCYRRDIDRAGLTSWLERCLAQPATIFMCRGDNSAGMAIAMKPFHSPASTEAHMAYLIARRNRGLEGYVMFRAMLEWARALNAPFCFGSTSEIDLSGFAKRVGAKPHNPSWVVPVGSPERP